MGAFQRNAFQTFTRLLGMSLTSVKESMIIKESHCRESFIAKVLRSTESFTTVIRVNSPSGPYHPLGMGVKRVKPGTEAYIQIKVFDNTVIPPLPMNPSAGVKITLLNPAGDDVVSDAAMTNEEVGVYSYLRQTATTDDTGSWSGTFKIENDGHVVLTHAVQLFVLTD